MRVFAISSKGVASELHYQPEYDDGAQKRRLGNKAAQRINYSLVRSADEPAGKELIVSSNGRTIRIVPGAMHGVVGQVRQSGGSARFAGWASDGARREPADQVAVFVNNAANHAMHAVVLRPDVAKHFKAPSLRAAGFQVAVSDPIFEPKPPPVVRVFAISSAGVASELSYRPEYDDGSQTLKLGRH